MKADASATYAIPEAYDFFETTRLLRTGTRDPTVRRASDGLWRTTCMAEGPATVRFTVASGAGGGAERPAPRLSIEAWGAGAEAAVADAPRWIGLDEPPWALPPHPVTDRLLREHRGVRSTDTGDVFAALVVAILQQLVTWEEAALGWRALSEAYGEVAPGPAPAGMRLPPAARVLRGVHPHRIADLGVGMQRARTIVEVARVAHALERARALPTSEASVLLQKVRGVGPWTAAMVLGSRLGRPEPILTGDYHLPDTIAWALAGEERGTEARMLELLAPFEGHAFRVVRLLFAAGIEAPKRGPRRDWRRPGRPPVR